MKAYKLALTASTAFLASASLSLANVVAAADSPITYSSMTNWGTSSNALTFSPTMNFTVDGFNSSLGTLTKVILTVDADVSGNITAKNTGDGDATFTAGLTNNLKVKVGPTGITYAALQVSSSEISVPSLAAGNTYGPTNVSASTSAQAVHTITSDLTAFESNWTVTAGDLGSVTSSISNGNVTFTSHDVGSMSIAVDYSYTPRTTQGDSVPEPASLGLLGGGLVGLGVLRRRRKNG